MTALDTDVLVRHFTRDDASQAEAARAFLATLSADKPGFICREVVVELVWVLDRSYGATRDQIATILLGLVATDSLLVESAEDVAASAIRLAETNHDFADLMISTAARRHAALPLVTFDRRAPGVDGVELLPAHHD